MDNTIVLETRINKNDGQDIKFSIIYSLYDYVKNELKLSGPDDELKSLLEGSIPCGQPDNCIGYLDQGEYYYHYYDIPCVHKQQKTIVVEYYKGGPVFHYDNFYRHVVSFLGGFPLAVQRTVNYDPKLAVDRRIEIMTKYTYGDNMLFVVKIEPAMIFRTLPARLQDFCTNCHRKKKMMRWCCFERYLDNF